MYLLIHTHKKSIPKAQFLPIFANVKIEAQNV